MYLVGKPLRTSEEIQHAIDRSIPVAVWQNGEMLDQGGLIEQHDESTVKINGYYFFKATCDFKTR